MPRVIFLFENLFEPTNKPAASGTGGIRNKTLTGFRGGRLTLLGGRFGGRGFFLALRNRAVALLERTVAVLFLVFSEIVGLGLARIGGFYFFAVLRVGGAVWCGGIFAMKWAGIDDCFTLGVIDDAHAALWR